MTPSSPVDVMRPLLVVSHLTRRFGAIEACRDIELSVFPGEVVGIVGESGSGKSTLLKCLSGHLAPDAGSVQYDLRDAGLQDIYGLSERQRRRLVRQEWGVVHQNPRDGLRMTITVGGNVGENLMALGARNYGVIRAGVDEWMQKVELDTARANDRPDTFSGGMQQRLQIARNLITGPRLLFMDEPTGGLDVSVQAKLLDLLRTLVRDIGIAVIIVTHDLAVVRLLADRLFVMRRGEIVEQGLTDQVLDDSQHPYTQLLVSSVLQI